MDVAEQPVAEPTSNPAAPSAPVEDSSSLSDHEAQFGPGAGRESGEDAELDGAPAPGERDGRGRYKSRNSRATAEDVPRIQALTKQARTAEAERDALKAERDALKSTAPASMPSEGAAQPPAPRALVQPPIPQQAIPQQFPTYEQFLAIEGYQDATYEDYVDARADWRYNLRRAAEKQQDEEVARRKQELDRVTAHQARLKEAKAKYTDWDTVVPNDLPISRVLHDAILASDQSTEIQYWLGQHREECAALVNESLDYSPSAVAAMRRYLDTVIAPVSTPARNVAAPTGSALALVPPPAPRPPNPVRTGTQAPADTPPGDESSLAAHEKFYGRPRR